jgi:hypothetical protein
MLRLVIIHNFDDDHRFSVEPLKLDDQPKLLVES